MQLQATKRFSATYNGERYSYKKGDKFTGSAQAAEYFKKLGLLGEVVRASKKEVENVG